MDVPREDIFPRAPPDTSPPPDDDNDDYDDDDAPTGEEAGKTKKRRKRPNPKRDNSHDRRSGDAAERHRRPRHPRAHLAARDRQERLVHHVDVPVEYLVDPDDERIPEQ